MQIAPLTTVQHRIKVGAPLPFGIRNAEGQLLLAKGQMIGNEAQLEALLSRGATVDIAELNSIRNEIQQAGFDKLPLLWAQAADTLGRLLKAKMTEGFEMRLLDVAKPIVLLIEKDPDLAIFGVIRQEAPGAVHYGVSHSLHTAITCYLSVKRLGWSEEDKARVLKAALTMNLSIVELQALLVTQTKPLSPQQREQINTHPMESAELLRKGGVRDPGWLDAVEQHHEVIGGKGYPKKLTEVGDVATMVRLADVYTAKLSARQTRQAIGASDAGRGLFTNEQGHPCAAAIIKEFGLYPPGTLVKLYSGECGVVIRRGETATTPMVAALTNRDGMPLMDPLRRLTTSKDNAIVGLTNEKAIRVRIPTEKLIKLVHS
jgi:HD-GYP domain-containing protein (c-di-GMP phosphodiesterase class II)